MTRGRVQVNCGRQQQADEKEENKVVDRSNCEDGGEEREEGRVINERGHLGNKDHADGRRE